MRRARAWFGLLRRLGADGPEQPTFPVLDGERQSLVVLREPLSAVPRIRPGSPLAANESGEFGRSGAVGIKAGNAQDAEVGQRLAESVGDVELDQECQPDMGERQVFGRG
ncbi:hypothetical protein SAMN05216489_00646 [Streptomyces sp. 3213]|uniref:hypothetical protein n=1 Tax=Streptomyces sp. 3213.3 TaxID=1855348 RepID=UPI0008960587|nr:hypothetical protein [Streptomyces sp. 3213.3]SEC40415.1 hypothetical protein SAMN05216489_00646 [Streptomyces sp. 3213] [Streptomyces sp. 3213.3]